MTDRFIDQHKNAWQRLEELLKLLDSSSLRRLHREEVRELGRIYRRTASDLAIARAESRDPRLINYLNNLVIRAHGRIYQADAEASSRIGKFFAHDFPETFRRTPCSATGTRASYNNYRPVLGGSLDETPGCLAGNSVNIRPRFTGKRPGKSEKWLKKHVAAHRATTMQA